MIGWLKRLVGTQAEPDAPAAPRRPVLTTDPQDAGGMTLLCPAYITHPTSFEDMRHWRQMVATRHPDACILASLDDLGQAGYTSFHSIETHGLDATDGHDLSALPPECFEDGEHVGALTTEAEFPIRLANFRKGLAAAPARDATLGWVDLNQNVSIADVNEDPDAVVDPKGLAVAVPVSDPADMIAAFPNGYFAGDLTPFDIHALATELSALGYQLIGLGASYLAFWTSAVLDPVQVAQRSTILAGLYRDADVDALNAVLADERHLILRYTD